MFEFTVFNCINGEWYTTVQNTRYFYSNLLQCNIRPWNFVTFSLCEKWWPEIDLRQQLYLIVSDVGICRFGSSRVWMGNYPSHTTCYCLFFCRPASQFLELPRPLSRWMRCLTALLGDSQLYFSNLLYTWRLSPCSEIFRRQVKTQLCRFLPFLYKCLDFIDLAIWSDISCTALCFYCFILQIKWRGHVILLVLVCFCSQLDSDNSCNN